MGSYCVELTVRLRLEKLIFSKCKPGTFCLLTYKKFEIFLSIQSGSQKKKKKKQLENPSKIF